MKDTKDTEGAGGMDNKRQEPGKGREEQMSEHPGPDPVHPEASRPVSGKSPEEVRKLQERRMNQEHDAS
ncbi:hypothetical protein ACFWUQ_06630 [Streptomyces sp. NPDC058662]|uniref:hypothetical protein n=1 Tax=Streptomyces sp. NPDC058662 TaxID=3346583 RepID=UPI00365A356E